MTLGRGGSHVIVPETATLGPAVVAAILRAAGIDPLEFVQAFDVNETPTSRENVA